MNNYRLTVAGLGPGDAGLMTRETWTRIEQAEQIVLRTHIHPSAEALDTAHIDYESYDGLYEKTADFETLYAAIVTDLCARVRTGNLLYLVPGSPHVAERTVQLLRTAAEEEAISLEILPGMSFLDPLFAAVGIDPVNGLSILDALNEEQVSAPLRQDCIFTQVYSRAIASDLKLLLMEHLSDMQEVYYLHHLSLPDQQVRRIPLFELDRQDNMDHLTTIFVPYSPFF